MERRGVTGRVVLSRLVSMAGELHIGAIWRELARRHGDRAAIVDDAGAWSYRQFQARIDAVRQRAARAWTEHRRPGRAAHPRCARISRGRLRHHGGRLGAGAARSAPHPQRSDRVAAACRRARAGHAPVVRRAGRGPDRRGRNARARRRDRWAGRVSITRRCWQRASERRFRTGDGDDLATLNFSGGTTGAPKATMLRHRNLATVAAQHDPRLRDRQRRRVFLNVRPLWPIAQVILMSLPVRRRDRGAAPVRSRAASRRWCKRPARPAPRWCRRNWCAASSTCRRAIRGSIGCKPSMSAARAFRQTCSSARWRCFGPKIGVLYGLTEAPVTCYLPPRQLDADAGRQRPAHSSRSGARCPTTRCGIAGADERRSRIEPAKC